MNSDAGLWILTCWLDANHDNRSFKFVETLREDEDVFDFDNRISCPGCGEKIWRGRKMTDKEVLDYLEDRAITGVGTD